MFNVDDILAAIVHEHSYTKIRGLFIANRKSNIDTYRFEEGYDLWPVRSGYIAWLELTHPEAVPAY